MNDSDARLVFWPTAVSRNSQSCRSEQNCSHGKVLALDVMRWLMIGLLVSLAVLLFAAAGLARHILQHRAMHRKQAESIEHSEETDLELEP